MNSKESIQSHCIDTCNKLLRGEISAVETYRMAIDKHSDSPAAVELSRICDEHSRAVSVLKSNVIQMGGEPDTTSGAWGVFANTVQGTANLFGAESAVESLQRGEQAGLLDYEGALEDDKVMEGCKELIRTDLLPSTKKHIAVLEKLEKIA